jgi:hypothetical protein
MKIKTIDVYVMEWFDKVNGNSYFAGTITLDYGMKTQKDFDIPFQYGYGEHYQTVAMDILNNGKAIDTHSTMSLWRYCQENNIILRTDKKTGCKKRDLIK